MKTLFLTYSDRNWPSSRIRAWNITDYWDGADCCQWQEGENLINSYDSIILQKVIHPNVFKRIIDLKGKRVFLDLCDPEWWLKDTKELLLKYLPYFEKIIVSSEKLSIDFFQTFGVQPVWIDDRFPFIFGVREHQKVAVVKLVWFGSTGNRAPCLNQIGETFHRLIAEGIKFELLIIDGEPKTPYLPNPWIQHIQWSRDSLHQILTSCDIALLPPYPGPWGTMKSNNKIATAYWAGLPTHRGIDYFSLKALIEDWKLRQKVGKANRKIAENNFEIHKSISQWQELVK